MKKLVEVDIKDERVNCELLQYKGEGGGGKLVDFKNDNIIIGAQRELEDGLSIYHMLSSEVRNLTLGGRTGNYYYIHTKS